MKRIITCSDGTWNKPGIIENGKYVQTNVQKMFEAICKTVTTDGEEPIHQMKFYDQGVGSEGNWLTRVIGGATGDGIDDNIKDVYKFIVWNYEEGDELFLFGFSRGAYTARSLAGLIRNCGILRTNDLTLIDKAYDIYRNRDDKALDPNGEKAKKFREKNSYPLPKIKFVGVWDTVGALGIPVHALQWNKNKFKFHDTTLSRIVQHAYHALAIDEKRRTFEPALWTLDKDPAKRNPGQVMEQVWFAGVHANVGGGYSDTGLSDIALDWLIDRSKDHGLGFDEPYLKANINPDPTDKIGNEYRSFYRIVPKFDRVLCGSDLTNESIHPSVDDRIKKIKDYQPGDLSTFRRYTPTPKAMI